MTEPLTSPDCDLRDFPYLQLDVARLRDSDLAATRSPEECWAAVLLWCASWHQVPAASLPDDDRVLSNLAGYGRVVKEWQRVKEGAMHGWIKCSDGRWYHPVIAEKASNALAEKRLHHYGKFKDRARKAYGKDAVIPSLDEWISAGMPTEWTQERCGIPLEHRSNSAGIPLENAMNSGGNENNSAGIPLENALKGEGEGEVKEEEERTASAVPRAGAGARGQADPPRTQSAQNPPENPQTAPPVVAKNGSKPQETKLSAQSMQVDLPGLSEAVAMDYLAFRKSIKAALTPSAWRSIASEVLASGYPPDGALSEAMAAGWRGFKADWLRNRSVQNSPQRPSARASPQPDPDAAARFAARIQGQSVGRIIEGERA